MSFVHLVLNKYFCANARISIHKIFRFCHHQWSQRFVIVYIDCTTWKCQQCYQRILVLLWLAHRKDMFITLLEEAARWSSRKPIIKILKQHWITNRIRTDGVTLQMLECFQNTKVELQLHGGSPSGGGRMQVRRHQQIKRAERDTNLKLLPKMRCTRIVKVLNRKAYSPNWIFGNKVCLI